MEQINIQQNSPLSKEKFVDTTSAKIVLSLVLLLFMGLNFVGKVDQQALVLVTLATIGYLAAEFALKIYLSFLLKVRETKFFEDNRSVNFLTFDMLKFILILLALIVSLVLGLNKILNNETVATLMGGLVGSLLTMRGRYSDVKPLSKEEQEKLRQSLM